MSKVKKAQNVACCDAQKADSQEECCAKDEGQEPVKEEEDVRTSGYRCC